MSREMSQEEYVSLLEDAISAGPTNQKPAGDRFPGYKYQGLPNGGDKILNWGGHDEDEDVKTDTDDISVKGIVENIMKDDDDDSPMSMLEADSYLNESQGETDSDPSFDAEPQVMDVDENISESVSLSPKESEILSRLLNEMNLLESDDNDEDDEYNGSDDVDPDEISDLELEFSDDNDEDD